jgi:hypothetical protein
MTAIAGFSPNSQFQIQNQLRQIDFSVMQYQSSGDKAHLLESLKLQAQIIDLLLQTAGMESDKIRLRNLSNLK